MTNVRFLLAGCFVLAGAAATAGENWPAFRGGVRGGVADDEKLPQSWGVDRNVVWKTDVPGRGWSSPVVWGDKVFVTTVVAAGKEEDPKKGLYFGGNRLTPPTDVHRWLVYCLDWNTGKVVWERQVHQGVPATPHHIKNTYASETPVTDGERLYVYFGSVGLFCFDLAGQPLWSVKMEPVPTAFGWGTASSPVLHEGRLYVVNDNEKKSFLLAVDAKTGKEIWRVDRDEKSTWATPYVWKNDQRTELVVPGRKKVRSYDTGGKVLWELAGMSSIVIPTPVEGHGLLYVSSGYVLDPVRPLYAIRPGSSGDISLKDGETSNAFIAWSQKTGGPYNPSPIVYGDHVYVLYDRGMLSCFDARTGKQVYDRERVGGGSSPFTASPWASGGKLYCLSEDGDTYVIQAGPPFKQVGKNSLDDMCMATPALLRGSVLIRTLTKVYRIAEDTRRTSRAVANTASGD